jgi:hypothetical protein
MQSRNMRNRDLSVTCSRMQTRSPLFLMQNTFCSTSMVTPILCRTRLILPVWSPLYYAGHVLFYQYGHPWIMQNTFYSTSMVTLYYAEHACPLHSLIKWNSSGKFIKAPSHAQHRAAVCQACKRHNATRITDISPMLWICQTTLDELH